MNDIHKKIESVLFLNGEPVSVARLASVLKEQPERVARALDEMQRLCVDRGIRLISHADMWQLVTAPEYAPMLEELVKSEYSERLSRAALETLAIVAYKGPITRLEIDFIRGVNSVYSLRNLLMRGLIEKTDNPHDGRSHVYRITFDCMRHFGISVISELPRYAEFQETPVPSPSDQPPQQRNES